MDNERSFIYMNGYPGVGKHTIAKELSKLIPGSDIYHNHLLIDPVAPVVPRGTPGYYTARTRLRREVLDILAKSEYARSSTWIFTDARSESPEGREALGDYRRTAKKCGARFVPVTLSCELGENSKRVADRVRASDTDTKLLDGDVLKGIRETEKLLCFEGEGGLELDVTSLSPAEAARQIADHVKMLQGSDLGGKRCWPCWVRKSVQFMFWKDGPRLHLLVLLSSLVLLLWKWSKESA